MQTNCKVNAAIESKSKATMIGDRRKEGKDHCFKCGEKGHIAW